LKILTLSDLKNSGGAAVATNRIASAIRSEGNQISSITSDGEQNQCNEDDLLFLGKKHQLAENLFQGLLSKQFLQKLRTQEWCRQLDILLQKHRPDQINVHNLHSAGWSIGLIKIALRHAPVAWTLHDCWSFLGTYYPTCSPAPKSEALSVMIEFWDFIKKGKTSHNLSALTPSAWMRTQASASHWDEMLVETIHNPIPDSFFKVRDPKACKKALGLSHDKPVVLCVAGNLDEERKGGLILKEILSSSLPDLAQFVLIGNGKGYDNSDPRRINSLGFVRDEVTMQIAYQAADLLLHPAPIDNLPNTVAEAMCCGTPTLAFDTGGLPEMIIPGKSGWLVKQQSAQSIITELRNLLASRSYESLRDSTRDTARNLFSEHIIASKYLAHFDSCTSLS
jgi:glycosyltransferase involved in cell wall biosynthesis